MRLATWKLDVHSGNIQIGKIIVILSGGQNYQLLHLL